jgi:Co/Zn/Cd efflux system component
MCLDSSQMMAAELPDPQNKPRRSRNVLPMLVLTCMVMIAVALVVNVAFGSGPLLQTAAIAMHVAWDLVALLLLRGAASRDKRLGVKPA